MFRPASCRTHAPNYQRRTTAGETPLETASAHKRCAKQSTDHS